MRFNLVFQESEQRKVVPLHDSLLFFWGGIRFLEGEKKKTERGTPPRTKSSGKPLGFPACGYQPDSPASLRGLSEARQAARSKGLEVLVLPMTRPLLKGAIGYVRYVVSKPGYNPKHGFCGLQPGLLTPYLTYPIAPLSKPP